MEHMEKKISPGGPVMLVDEPASAGEKQSHQSSPPSINQYTPKMQAAES
jgi:hypothetical protein